MFPAVPPSLLLCQRENDGTVSCCTIGGTTDLNAGQAIDRTGVMMGLSFPCGKELDALSQHSLAEFGKIKVSVQGMNCSLSGLENKTKAMWEADACREDVAAYLFEYISRVLISLTENLRAEYPELPILYAGGVMSNSRIRKNLSYLDKVYFASPALSSDNACGTGLLAYEKFTREVL